jgi:hypothetical protein
MRKNITALLQKGDIKPKERVLLLVANQVSEERDGKSILTEADKHALSEGWTPKDNNEVREYNRFNEGWRLAVFAEMDAQTTFLITKAEHFRKYIITTELNLYPFYREQLNIVERLKNIKVVDIKEAIEITNKQREQKLKNGIDFDYAIYQLAFESLSDDFKKDLKTLYDEVEYEHQYLDQEETIANLLNGKNELTKEAKEKLAELVADKSYNKYAGKYQLYHYFAGIPLAEVARYFLASKGVKIKGKPLAQNQQTDDEDSQTHKDIQKVIEDYARDNKVKIETILKEACLKWLDGDLLEQYTPLVLSESKATYSGDTKHPHNEIFKEWLKAKEKARATIQKLIDKGELKTEETGQDKTITGESLYNFKSDFEFVKDFKKQVDEYDANAGLIYADDDPEQKGDNLDQELLIADKDEDGKPAIVSIFGMSVKRIESGLQPHFFKEVDRNGKAYLEFKNEGMEKMFKEIRESLISGYAKLLAFEDIFKRLSKTYETDLTGKIKNWRESVSEFIDQHNDALKRATGQKLWGGEENEEAESWLIEQRGVLKTKDDLFIDKEKITPNKDGLESYYTKFKDALGNDF